MCLRFANLDMLGNYTCHLSFNSLALYSCLKDPLITSILIRSPLPASAAATKQEANNKRAIFYTMMRGSRVLRLAEGEVSV